MQRAVGVAQLTAGMRLTHTVSAVAPPQRPARNSAIAAAPKIAPSGGIVSTASSRSNATRAEMSARSQAST